MQLHECLTIEVNSGFLTGPCQFMEYYGMNVCLSRVFRECEKKKAIDGKAKKNRKKKCLKTAFFFFMHSL